MIFCSLLSASWAASEEKIFGNQTPHRSVVFDRLGRNNVFKESEKIALIHTAREFHLWRLWLAQERCVLGLLAGRLEFVGMGRRVVCVWQRRRPDNEVACVRRPASQRFFFNVNGLQCLEHMNVQPLLHSCSISRAVVVCLVEMPLKS